VPHTLIRWLVFSSGGPWFSPNPGAEPFAIGYAVHVWRHSCGSFAAATWRLESDGDKSGTPTEELAQRPSLHRVIEEIEAAELTEGLAPGALSAALNPKHASSSLLLPGPPSDLVLPIAFPTTNF
jgi:hypothetical protein